MVKTQKSQNTNIKVQKVRFVKKEKCFKKKTVKTQNCGIGQTYKKCEISQSAKLCKL